MLVWDRLLCEKRLRKTTSDLLHRTEFERDYDRAIFSTPVRRLQDKAQVFPLEPHDAVRTRLTHSLEVSTVARDLCRRVARRIQDPLIKPEAIDNIATIGAVCGLLHDLGNPPFGHAGEDAIKEWFQTRSPEFYSDFGGLGRETRWAQDLLRFDGNAQTIRLITHLPIMTDFFGLNLTAATISAACKYTNHSNYSGPKTHLTSKPGYFYAEDDRIREVRQHIGTGDSRHPLAFLTEASDDIVYSVVDVEDAIKRGVFTWRELRMHLRKRLPLSSFTVLMRGTDKILQTYEGDKPIPDDIRAQAMRVAALGKLIDAAAEAFMSRYDEVIQGIYCDELIKDVAAFKDGGLISALKDIAMNEIIPHRDIVQLELMGRKVIHDLMDRFWVGVSSWKGHVSSKEPFDRKKDAFAAKIYSLISSNFRALFEYEMRRVDPKTPDAKAWYQYFRSLLVIDQISGMTDTFAVTLHQRLSNV